MFSPLYTVFNGRQWPWYLHWRCVSCPWRPQKRASTAVKDVHWQGHALVCKVWCLADDEQRKALALCSFTVWAGYILLVSWKTVRSVATRWENQALSHRGSAKNDPCFSSLLHTVTMTSWNIPGHVHVDATNMTIPSAGQQIPGNGNVFATNHTMI